MRKPSFRMSTFSNDFFSNTERGGGEDNTVQAVVYFTTLLSQRIEGAAACHLQKDSKLFFWQKCRLLSHLI